MATQPKGHPVIPAEHVSTSKSTIPLPQSLQLKLPEPATPQTTNTNPLRGTTSAQSQHSPTCNSTHNAPSPHISAPDNVVTRNPLLPPSDPTPLQSSTPVSPNVPPASAAVASISAPHTDSPPKRRKIEIVAPEIPRSQAVVHAMAVSASESLRPFLQCAKPHPAVLSRESEIEDDVQDHTSLPQPPQEDVVEISPSTDPTNTSFRAQSILLSRSPVKTMNTSRASMSNEVVPKVVNLPHHTHVKNETSLPVSENWDTEILRARKSTSPSTSTASGQGTKLHNDDTLQPDVKRLKTDQTQSPDVPLTPPLETALLGEIKPREKDVTERDLNTVKVDGEFPKPLKQGKLSSLPISPTSGVSLPLLRSSPVFVEHNDRPESNSPSESGADKKQPDHAITVFPDSNDKNVDMNAPNQQQQTEEHGRNTTSATKRKRKTVSWAPEEKLIDVQFIDNRMELVRSWDTDFQITLPFAPATLLMFQQALKDQETAVRNEGQSDGKGTEAVSLRSMPKLTSFEEARKREHDMEQERARQARQELKERLNAMTPAAQWKVPTAIVLPAECRIEEASIKDFNLSSTDDYCAESAECGTDSPPSPPHKPSESSETSKDKISVPMIPLSDRLAQNGESESQAVPTVVGVDIQSYERSDSHQDYYSANHDGNGPNDGSNTNLKPRSDSSKDFHYRDPSNDTHCGTDRDLLSETPRASRGQYGNGPNEYSSTNSTASPSQAQAVQHLLSALQNSGLLKQGQAFFNDKNRSSDYNRNLNEQNGGTILESRCRDSQQVNQHDIRNQDSTNNYENEKNENDRPQEEDAVPSQSMPAPDGNMPPPMLSPTMGASFPPSVQQAGVMDMLPFPGPMGHPPMGMPPMGLPPGGIPPGAIPPPPPPPPPPPIGIPPPLSMLQMMGVHVPMMTIPPGIQMNEGGQSQSTSNNGTHSGGGSGRSGAGRGVETISRPKPKPMKQRKRCKYFGTKQGCRDGSSCMFAHN